MVLTTAVAVVLPLSGSPGAQHAVDGRAPTRLVQPASSFAPAVDDLRHGQPTATPVVPIEAAPPPQRLPMPPASDLAVLGAPAAGPAQAALASAYLRAVRSAPASCRLQPEVLAAIGQVESGSAGGRSIDRSHRVVPAIYGPALSGGQFAAIPDTDGGRLDGDTRWDRAVGPMQFIPSTWRTSGVDGDADGKADPQNVYDATASAAGYLCRNGRDLGRPADLRAAVLSYNDSAAYLATVLAWVGYFDRHGLAAMGSVSFTVPTATGPAATSTTLPAAMTDRTATPAPSPTAAATTQPPASTPGTPTPDPTTTTPTPDPTTTTSPGTPKPRASSPTPTPTGTPSPTTGTPTPDPTTTPTPDPTTTTPAPDPTTAAPVAVEPGMVVTLAREGRDDVRVFFGDAADNTDPTIESFDQASHLGKALTGTHVGDQITYTNASGVEVTATIKAAEEQSG